MLKSFKYLAVISVLFLSGCNKEKIEVLDEDFLDTKIGTVEQKKFVVKKEPEKKVVKEKIVKQDLKKYDSYKKQKNKILNKKEQFSNILVPVVVEVYKELDEKYQQIKSDIENKTNREEIKKLKRIYKAKNDIQLLHALKPHPVSIVLAQSAIESAWLTSRFAKEANNIFGVWSFNKNEPRIAASGLRGDKTIYLKKYDSLKDAVRDYYKSVARSWAYKELRYIRTVTNDPMILLPYFRMYSEKRDEYVKVLEKVLVQNKFDQYDIKD